MQQDYIIAFGPAIIIYIPLAIIIGFAGINRKGGFWRAFLLSLVLTPLISLFITIGSAKKDPRGCTHCGNDKNEAEYCGICGKNYEGDLLEP
ncbi:MAG: hypothetical protein JXR19_09225 [Bacteroidia bacterium]